MRILNALLLAVASVALASSAGMTAPPTVKVPERIVGEAGDFIPVVAETDGVSVKFVVLDPGLKVFPPGFLKDPKTTVVTGPKGQYRLLVYTGTADGPSDPVIVLVVVGGATAPPPKDPPVKDPPIPVGGYYFLIVRADGPASPEFTRVVSDPAWDDLRAKKHLVKDKTSTDAAKLGVKIPSGTTLPVVVTLKSSADGTASTVARGPVPLPTTPAGIARLLEDLEK